MRPLLAELGFRPRQSDATNNIQSSSAILLDLGQRRHPGEVHYFYLHPLWSRRDEQESRHSIYKHILIPTDGSELSQNAIAHGAALAKSINAKVTILTVSTPFHTFAVEPEMVTDTPEQYAKHMANRAAKYLNSAQEAVAAAGVNCDTVHVEHDHPYQAIIDTAAREPCDLIVMASHGRRGVSAIMLGSETVKVLTHGAVPVLVVRASHPATS